MKFYSSRAKSACAPTPTTREHFYGLPCLSPYITQASKQTTGYQTCKMLEAALRMLLCLVNSCSSSVRCLTDEGRLMGTRNSPISVQKEAIQLLLVKLKEKTN